MYKSGVRVEKHHPEVPRCKKAKLATPLQFAEDDLKRIANSSLAMMLHAEAVSESEKCVSYFLENLLDEVFYMIHKKDVNDIVNFVDASQHKFNIYINNYTYNLTNDLADFYIKNIQVNLDEIKNIAIKTLGQSSSLEWFTERKIRISASIAHDICHTKDPEKLANKLIAKKPFQSAATSYGLRMEKVCLEMLEQEIGEEFKIVEIGSVVKKVQPYYICSADAILINKITKDIQILEIKSPYSCKTKPIFDPVTNTINVTYVERNGDKFVLKKNHSYYTQVQLLLYILNLTLCQFIVYSPHGSILFVVERDEDFLQRTIPNLEKFYFRYYLKKLN